MKSVIIHRLIKEITHKSHTAVELAGIVHCHVRTSRLIVAKLKQQGVIYIEEWRRVEYNDIPAAAYRYGIGDDAVKPRPLTSAEKARKWRGAESVESKAFRLARLRQLRRKIKRDPLMAAFFGATK